MARTFIYFIGSENGPIKIGKAKNVKLRLSGLQTGHPDPLHILGVMLADERLEAALHYQFRDSRVRGEWFQRTQELLHFIEQNTMASDAVYYYKINQDEEIQNQKNELKAEIKKQKAFFQMKEADRRKHAKKIVFDRMEKLLAQSLAEFWLDHIKLTQTVIRVIREFNKRNQYTLNEDWIWKELRDATKGFCDVDWREAEALMAGEYPSGKAITVADIGLIEKARHSIKLYEFRIVRADETFAEAN